MPPEEDSRSAVLVVDLDGTLCHTDTLHEGILKLAATEPLMLLQFPRWLATGRTGFKGFLADQVILDSEDLPLNNQVIAFIRAARKKGQKTALVSASEHRQVSAIAEKTGLFDEAYGSAGGRNLKGKEKAAFLTERYGKNGFDYIGDSFADIAVWKVARNAITVMAGSRLRRAAESANSAATHLTPPIRKVPAMLRALRPHQWSKNLLLFLPMFAAHDFGRLLFVVLAFIAFSLTASAVYVVNDLLDLASDRAHPRKRLRPFASGELAASTGILMAAVLLVAAMIFGLLTHSIGYLATLGCYFLTAFLYSLWLKRKLIVDVLALAGLYTIRIIAGGAAAAIVLSPWLLGLSIFLFLSLAAVKRQAELTDQIISGRQSTGRAYSVDDLPVLRGVALSSAHAAVLVLALYISSDNVQQLYSKPYLLWIVCPSLLYWLLRMVMKSHRGTMTDDPIVFAATDRVSMLIIASSMAVGIAAI